MKSLSCWTCSSIVFESMVSETYLRIQTIDSRIDLRLICPECFKFVFPWNTDYVSFANIDTYSYVKCKFLTFKCFVHLYTKTYECGVDSDIFARNLDLLFYIQSSTKNTILSLPV